MRRVSSWGRLSADAHDLIVLTEPNQVANQLLQEHRPAIPYGMGRSYGDVCLNANGVLFQTSGLNHFISFDPQTGYLVCEAGVLLRDIQRLMIPNGWMLPVTPGTQFVTVGGAVANDVHGKNHHCAGSFGNHVQHIKLIRSNGDIIYCTPNVHADWFAATVGGLGLTGLIVEVALQLLPVQSPWFETETLPFDSLDDFFQIAEASKTDWQYTVSWIDCLSRKGRGLFMRANPVDDKYRVIIPPRTCRIPFVPPISLVNRMSLQILNSSYYRFKQSQRAHRHLSHYESFFYPLDRLLQWNRLYGPRGFFQHQSVLPVDDGSKAVEALLQAVAQSGLGSFLAVLKTFGEYLPVGMMSFPMPGVTLALDFPNNGVRTHKLLATLDHIVKEAGGRIYLAKDARASQDVFLSGYPRLSEFLKYRDPGMSSELSRRLIGS